MDLQTAIDELKPFTSQVPTEALDTIRQTWPAAEPELLAELDRRIVNPADDDPDALFLYALHLCAEMNSEAAFERYVKILRMPTLLLDQLLGDMISESIPSMLIRTCGGRINELKRLVEDPAVYEFARATAVRALTYLSLHDGLPRKDHERYLIELLDHRLERRAGYIWDTVISAAADLHVQLAMPLIELAYKNGWADPMVQPLEDALETCMQSVDKENTDVQWDRERAETFRTEKAMHFFVSNWSEDRYEPDPEKLLEAPAKARNQKRRPEGKEPGRNEPCPCGSGRKYKKCCIDTGFESTGLAPEHPRPKNRADEWIDAGYYYQQHKERQHALQCWRQGWQTVQKMLPAEIKDPGSEQLNDLFNSVDFFSNWIQDVQMLFEELSSWNAETARNGIAYCRSIMDRFPHMDELMKHNFIGTLSQILLRTGQKEEAFRLLEQMIADCPQSAQGYALLAGYLSDEAHQFNLTPDLNRAQQLLLQAKMNATDCPDWDIDYRLKNLS